MLIFDEAHNIEDVCREAASVELDLEVMVEVCCSVWAAEQTSSRLGGCHCARELLLMEATWRGSALPAPIVASVGAASRLGRHCLPPLPPLTYRPQVLIALKKAVECNGKPEVYDPLASCAEAVVGWMRVRCWPLQGAGLLGNQAAGCLAHGAPARRGRGRGCQALVSRPLKQDKEHVAVEHMRHQQTGGRFGGGGGRGLARYQDPYERLFPSGQVRWAEHGSCLQGPGMFWELCRLPVGDRVLTHFVSTAKQRHLSPLLSSAAMPLVLSRCWVSWRCAGWALTAWTHYGRRTRRRGRRRSR